MIIKNKNYAFTLAEVLITLGIIGIVAAMTLPSLIAGYQKKVFVNQLKKAVSVVEQGFYKRMADIEVTDLTYGGVFEMLDPEVYKVELRKTFNVVSTCVQSESCMPRDPKTGRMIEYKPLRSGTPPRLRDFYVAVLKDGTIFGIREMFCSKTTNGNFSTMKDNCGFVLLDVNGTKGPNQYGRDVFFFVLAGNAHLYPVHGREWSLANFGNEDKTWRQLNQYCDVEYADSSGEGCAARVIEEGWEMKY